LEGYTALDFVHEKQDLHRGKNRYMLLTCPLVSAVVHEMHAFLSSEEGKGGRGKKTI